MSKTLNITDYTDARRTAEAGRRLLERAQEADFRLTPALCAEVKEWLLGVKNNIGGVAVHERLQVLAHYDLLHRAAYGRPAPAGFVSGQHLEVFEACVRGNALITTTDLYAVIAAGIERREGAYYGRPLEWLAETTARWVSESRYTAGFPGLSPDEAERRIELLLQQNLAAYLPDQEKYKARLRGKRIKIQNQTNI